MNTYRLRYVNNHSKRCRERQGNNNNTTERQSNTMQLARNSHFSKKNWLPRLGLEPTTISSPDNTLTMYNICFVFLSSLIDSRAGVPRVKPADIGEADQFCGLPEGERGGDTQTVSGETRGLCVGRFSSGHITGRIFRSPQMRNALIRTPQMRNPLIRTLK